MSCTPRDDQQAYCLKCLTLSSHPCPCPQCEVCYQHYADPLVHVCSGAPTICVPCNNHIISASGMCIFCDLDDIKSVCNQITPTNEFIHRQCLRCLNTKENECVCNCKKCGDCNLYYPQNKPHKCIKKKMHADSVLRQLYHIVDNVYTVFSQRKKTFALNVP